MKRTPPHLLPHRICSFCIKVCTHEYRRTPKLGSTETPLSKDGTEVWQTTRYMPLPHIFPCGTSASCVKECIVKDREPRNWGALGSCSLGIWVWLTPANKPRGPFHVCYHVEFSSYASKGVRREPPKIWDVGPAPLWWGVADSRSNGIRIFHFFCNPQLKIL